MEPLPELSHTKQPADKIIALLEEHMQIPAGNLGSYFIIGIENHPDGVNWRFVSSTNLPGTPEILHMISEYMTERILSEDKIGEAREIPGQTPSTD